MSSYWWKRLGLQAFKDTFRSYVQTQLSLLKYQFFFHTYRFIFLLIGLLLLFSLWVLAFLFASFALVQYLNAWLDGVYMGYLLVAALYFLLGIFLLLILRSPRLWHRIGQLAVNAFADHAKQDKES